MTVKHMDDIEGKVLSSDELKGVTKWIALSPNDGWSGWVMRVLEVKPGGYTPFHTHTWPHINYILEGSGILTIDGVEYPIRQGSVSHVDGTKKHNFRNNTDRPLRFICIVPQEGDTDYLS
ncbi:cupin domain-containing protein [Myxococcota bacterium]|nr:cupin domain-containing protein [Myxococcota bacterium]